jgi:hypothetical protein
VRSDWGCRFSCPDRRHWYDVELARTPSQATGLAEPRPTPSRKLAQAGSGLTFQRQILRLPDTANHRIAIHTPHTLRSPFPAPHTRARGGCGSCVWPASRSHPDVMGRGRIAPSKNGAPSSRAYRAGVKFGSSLAFVDTDRDSGEADLIVGSSLAGGDSLRRATCERPSRWRDAWRD